MKWPWVKSQIVPPVNIPIPTKIGSKMGGEFTYPKVGSQNGFDPQPNGLPLPLAWHLWEGTWKIMLFFKGPSVRRRVSWRKLVCQPRGCGN